MSDSAPRSVPVEPVRTGPPLREAWRLLLLAVTAAAVAWLIHSPRLPLRADPAVYELELPAPLITPAQAVALYEEGRAVFVDTRPRTADGRRIPGAFPLRQESFDTDFRELFEFTTPTDTLVLYGDGDLTALAAPAARLQERGYTGLLLLRGGLDAWRRAGGEIATAAPAATGEDDHD